MFYKEENRNYLRPQNTKFIKKTKTFTNMEHSSEDSNSSVGSYQGHCSPLNYSKQPCQLSTKATAFSIDALIGKRTLAKMQAQPREYISGMSSDEREDCESPKGSCCDSPPEKRSRHIEPLAPLGKVL